MHRLDRNYHRARIVLATLVVAMPICARAQSPARPECQAGTDTSDAALAARYAPVLRFAPGEPDFPTLPFFYAFDGIDNNNNGKVDFDDPDEIAAFNPGDTLYPSWSILDERYNTELVAQSPAGGTPVAPVPAVFWHVIDMTPEQQDVMSRFLKKDLLAWDAASRTEIGTTSLLDQPFKVIEYYFYYVRDRGLVGHPQDIEFTFVFVPADPALACIARIVAGAGHTDWIPNNILLLSSELALSPNAAAVDTLTGILTELGGHSSSPDAPPYGTFRLGVDVNWQSTKAWGVRDVQALAHMGYGGSYQQEMTLPRDTVDHPVFYWPRGSEHGYGQDYSLIPAPLFERLYARLDTVADGVKPGQWPATVDAIRQLLDSVAMVMHVPPFEGVATLDSTAVLRMATWNRPMMAGKVPGGGKVDPNRGQVWKHSAYSDWPTEIFESHLYAPTVKSIEKPVDIVRLVTWGVSEWPGNGSQIQVGLVLPWIYLPIVPRGFATFDVGFIASNEWTTGGVSLNLTYISSFFQRVSWYSTFAYIFNDEVIGSHFTVAVGPSLLLWRNVHQRLLNPLNTLRLSTGPRFRLSGPSSEAGVDWEFRFTFRQ